MRKPGLVDIHNASLGDTAAEEGGSGGESRGGRGGGTGLNGVEKEKAGCCNRRCCGDLTLPTGLLVFGIIVGTSSK